jgi:hypothetical protein
MLGMKMLPVQANATNTVALWPGQLTSIAAYRNDIRKHPRMVWPMALAGFIGGTLGAVVLLNTPQMTFLHLVPWLLLVAASIFAVSGPVSRWLERRNVARRKVARLDVAGRTEDAGATGSGGGIAASPSHSVWVFVAIGFVCFYIGYFGAGAGFLIITVLSLFGFQDLNEINALKVVATTLANGIAFLIFVVDGQVVWRYCLLAMVTCAIGGYTSASLARRVPQAALRATVVVIGLGMAAWFFWRNP